LYEAMDWLLDRQARIEQKLAARHLRAGGLVLYDLTSSYFEGTTCPLAAFGHNRDGKKGKLQVNYGLLTDGRGRPVAGSVFPDHPGERLVACRNPELAKLRTHKRQALLEATVKELAKVRVMVARGTLKGRDAIGVRVGKVVNKYKVAKHVQLEIHDARFAFQIDAARVAAEAALDGIYVIRTSVPAARLGAADAVRHYKQLSDVERAFRALKTIDLKVRPIRHRLEARVRAHIFLCLLAYYVEWHMREAWRPVLFGDEDQAAKRTRDPVAPAKRSPAALRKVHTKVLDDGTPVHSFPTLLKELSSIVRNVCRPRS